MTRLHLCEDLGELCSVNMIHNENCVLNTEKGIGNEVDDCTR